jgi:hypothetical protein
VIRCSTPVAYGDLKKGYYTVRVKAYASEEVGKARMTRLEGAVWFEGKGDAHSQRTLNSTTSRGAKEKEFCVDEGEC